MAAYVQDSNFFTRRTIVLFAIIALHVFIAWALATGLARRAIELVAPPIQTEVVEEVQKKDEPPPPPPPQMERPPVEIPPPDVAIEVPQETQTTAIVDVTDKPVPHAPPPPPAPVAKKVQVAPKPGKGFPSSEDYYPPASKRLGEEGSANIHVCVGPNGKLTEDPTLAQTSGSARLDDGALKLAKAASGHYTPGTEDGQATAMCTVFKIKFELRN
jgi:periplasmic protein TonB